MRRAAIKGDLLDAAMRFEQDGAAGGFIDAARFHADKAPFHQIKPANAVFASQLVQAGQDRRRRHGFAVDRHRIAELKANFDKFSVIRRLFWADGALIDIIGRFNSGIFQHLALG